MPISPLDGPLGDGLLKVISGSPSPEELAVVVALLTALAADGGAAAPADDGRGAPPVRAGWSRRDGGSPCSWAAVEPAAGS
ncbi:acyl-CoA carboxylase epsilon subunit [Streptomyces sp. NPDC091287]|uniref:acyl-CoA carboxylase epsilon subunit n=1 Tax=Streptomyces sp. NPDC091287 TaxID=3365988 RepID=UPI00381AF950